MDPLDLDLADYVALSPGVTLDGERLVDAWGRRAYPLTGSGPAAIALFDGRRTLRDVAGLLADERGADRDVVATDLRELVSALDTHALVRVRKNLKVRSQPIALWTQVKTWLTLDWRRQPARRLPPTTLGLVRAVVLSCRTGLLGAVTTGLALAGVLVPAAQVLDASVLDVATAAVLPLLLFGVLMLHLLAHEGGHVLALRRLTSAPHFVTVRGIRLAVAHRGATRAQMRAVAAAGPTAGLLAGLLLALIFLVADADSVWVIAAAVLSASHIYSFLPWAADGRMILRSGTA